METDQLNSENVMEGIHIDNAGLVLFYPFYARLFQMLDLLEINMGYRFKDKESQLKAIFLMQYIVYGNEKTEFTGQELALNKLIVGWEDTTPIPRQYDLSEKEKKMVEDMLEAAKQHWPKLKGTSVITVRVAFIQRPGLFKQGTDDRIYEMKVEEKAYDVLLDSLPWSISILRLYNSSHMLQVKWR